jgi:FtsP/CotA-like multicopper oxidase with cupredoxin domain
VSARYGCSLTMRLLQVLLVLVWPTVLVAVEVADGRGGTPSVLPNDNRRPAGETRGGTLRLALRAGLGSWQPEEDAVPALQVEAFGELTGPLQVPAPLVRVREGTAIVVSIRNDLPTPLQVHGLCARDGSPCPVLDVPAGEVREVRFTSGLPGTYYYWATTTGMPLSSRGSTDTQLSGALVVDPAEGTPTPDRVLVITEWTSLTRAQLAEVISRPDPGSAFLRLRPKALYAVNGRAWPHTERLTYDLGEQVHWRFVNLSTEAHPMHLHGFYFDVEREGNEARDEAIAPSRRMHEVTHLMVPGSTMSMAWTPERVGRWLLHCHTMLHVSSTLNVDGSSRPHEEHGHDEHLGAGMTGLVVGIVVRGPEEHSEQFLAGSKARQLTLVMQQEPHRFGAAPAFGFLLAEGSHARPAGPVPVPGPVLVLRRGEPVAITLVNRLPESTSIHWHGMELASVYDGVHGWSGSGNRATPSIEPGGTFVVHFTPPRAGTFIYHTHLHDNKQLTSGLYGAMLVLEPDEAFDENVDHVFVLGRGGPAMDAPTVINGQSAPQVIWTAGTRHRVRLINITPNDILNVSLRAGTEPVTWRPLAKDGAALPTERSVKGSAVQVIAVGETYDVEYEAPPGRHSLWLEARSTGGKWHAQGQVIVK